jgi:hypothetical protein
LVVSKTSQSITWGGTTGTFLTTTPDFAVTATASLTPVTITVVSGPAIITSGTIHLTGYTGTVVLSATQAGNAIYSSVTSTTSFTVAQGFAVASGPGNTLKLVNPDMTNGSSAVVDNTIQISIYPNPSNGTLFINSNQGVNVASVYSLTGELISKVDCSGQMNKSLDLSGLPKGIYFIQFTTAANDQQIVKKVILE